MASLAMLFVRHPGSLPAFVPRAAAAAQPPQVPSVAHLPRPSAYGEPARWTAWSSVPLVALAVAGSAVLPELGLSPAQEAEVREKVANMPPAGVRAGNRNDS